MVLGLRRREHGTPLMVGVESRPQHLEPSGRFLFAAGQGAAKVAAYRVDLLEGGLERIGTYDVGEGPWWVKAIHFK